MFLMQAIPFFDDVTKADGKVDDHHRVLVSSTGMENCPSALHITVINCYRSYERNTNDAGENARNIARAPLSSTVRMSQQSRKTFVYANLMILQM